MAITVCIEIDDSGAISVGTEPEDQGSDQGAMAGEGATPPAGATPGMTDLAQPQGDDESAEPQMTPAKSIEQALSMARDLLKQAMPQGGAVMGGDPGGAGAQASADAAFKSRRGYKTGM